MAQAQARVCAAHGMGSILALPADNYLGQHRAHCRLRKDQP